MDSNKVNDISRNFEEVEVHYFDKFPFLNITFTENNTVTKLQKQLIYFTFVEFRFRKYLLSNDTNILEFLRFIKSNSYNNLYRLCMRCGFPLIPCFLIHKKLISIEVLNSFVKTNDLFNNLNYYFTNKQDEIIIWYETFWMNKNIIFQYPNIFSIKSFSPILKYPEQLINRYFKMFDWDDVLVIKKQQPSFGILIEYIEELSNYFIDTAEKNYLTHDEANSLRLIKEML